MGIIDTIVLQAKNGKFVSSFCVKCKNYVWPPHDYCKLCNSPIVLRNVATVGILLAKSTSHIPGKLGHFGLGEFEGVRIVGTIKESLLIGDKITICNVQNRNDKIDLEFCIYMQ